MLDSLCLNTIDNKWSWLGVSIMAKTISDFVEIYGERIISIIESCDGSKSLELIAKESNIPIETLLFVAEKMVLAGLLEVQH